MARQVTIRAFDAWKLDPRNWDAFFRLITEEGLSLRNAAMKLKQPYTLVFPFIHDGAEMQKRYELAQKAVARRLMDETLPIADSVRKTKIPARVSAAKLAIEARQVYAAHADRDRFGEVVRVEKTVSLEMDAGLVGTIGDLLRVKRAPVTFENAPGQVLEQADSSSASALLPAPAVVEG